MAAGTTVVLAAPLPIGFVVAACKVVVLVDERSRSGFAYGTLPEHPEQGEEYFEVELRDDEVVVFRVIAFSRPGQAIARATAPLARLLQVRATNGYLQAMRDGSA
jgi:uncharacterized protein (UPF0548 family)